MMKYSHGLLRTATLVAFEKTMLRLSQALGTSAEMWLSMQAAYDLWRAGKRRRPRVKRIAA